MESSEYNLFEFYRLIGRGNYATYDEYDGFNVVSGKMGAWPQMIFKFEPCKDLVNQINNAFNISNGAYRITALCNRKGITQTDQEFMRDSGIFPADIWTLMEYSGGTKPSYNTYDLDFRKLESQLEIGAFRNLINEELPVHQNVQDALIKELILDEGVDIYGLFSDDQLVSGLLTFTDELNVAGLYFITTRREYRRKGYALELIEKVLQEVKKKGHFKIVLQSFSRAVNLYEKVGFIKKGEIIVFLKQ